MTHRIRETIRQLVNVGTP